MGVRADQKAATRVRLLEASRALFAERGVAAVSIQDVAEAAGVAVGTVYVHFEGKGALVDAVVEELNAGLRRTLARAFTESTAVDHRGLTHDVARAFIAYWRAHTGFLDLYADHIARHLDRDLLRQGTNRALPTRLVSGLRQVAPLLGLQGDPVLLGNGLVQLWRGVALSAVELPPERDEESVVLLGELTDAVVGRLAPGVHRVPVVVLRRALGGVLGA